SYVISFFGTRAAGEMKKISETVRDSAEIGRVVSDYVALMVVGNTLKGLCLFHSEKTPSFTAHRQKQFFHCFGCGAGGDVFEFVMQTDRVTFPESVRIVAEKCGIPIPAETSYRGADKGAEERKQLFDVYERAAAYFRKSLESAEAEAA